MNISCFLRGWSSSPSWTWWSVWMDSNHRPRAYQARALATWATDRYNLSVDMVRIILGGDDGVRTHDPLLAGQVLSQLSYTPDLGFEEWSSKIEQQDLSACKHRTLVNGYLLYSEYGRFPQDSSRFSIERRWSSRTFRYGYLVTT